MKTKQTVVMRKDLNMRKGKMVAQGSHASLNAILALGEIDENEIFTIDLKKHKDFKSWIETNYKKICLGANNETELVKIFEQAKAAGLPCSLVTDSGLTEFGGVPTITCCSIGPSQEEEIDKITSELKPL